MGTVAALLGVGFLVFCAWVLVSQGMWRQGRTAVSGYYPRIQSLTVRGFEGFLSDRGEYTEVDIYLVGHRPGAIKIFPWRVRNTMEHRLGLQDIRVGDPRFDSLAVIKANPESLVHRLFSPERKAELIAAVERLRPFPGFLIDLSFQVLKVRTWPGPRLRDPAAQLLVQTATTFAERILDLEQGAGIQWVEEAVAAQGTGTCQICGGELREQVVECAKCRTPHHRDCWLYLRQCSTYACGESRFRVDGRDFRPGGGIG